MIETDASSRGIGAVLEQEDKPVEFAFRAINDHEIQDPAYQNELKAIVHALGKWKYMTGDKQVVVETDDATLTHMLKQEVPTEGWENGWITWASST